MIAQDRLHNHIDFTMCSTFMKLISPNVNILRLILKQPGCGSEIVR